MIFRMYFLAVCLILLASGCAHIEDNILVQGKPTDKLIEDANQTKSSISRILQTQSMAIDSLPIGAIIAFFPNQNLTIPDNWQYCDGEIVNDIESPFHGSATPMLLDDRFLMGSIDSYGNYGASNIIEPDGDHLHETIVENSGSHNHNGLTGIEESNGTIEEMKQQGEINVRITEQGHRHTVERQPDHSHQVKVDASSVHTHGNDKRPQFFGVLFIIKIK